MPLLLAFLYIVGAWVALDTPEPRIGQRLAWAQGDLGTKLTCDSPATCDDVALKVLALTSAGALETARTALTGITHQTPLSVVANYTYWTASGDDTFLRAQWPRLTATLFTPSAERIITDSGLELAAADAALAMARVLSDSATTNRVQARYAELDRNAQDRSGVFGAAFGVINADSATREVSALADSVHTRFPLATGLLALALYEQHRDSAGYALLREMAFEQRSTSAMFVLPVMRGLLGWETDTPNRAVGLEPHLPAGWTNLSARGLVAGSDTLAVSLHREQGVYTIQLRRSRSVPALAVQLSPALPRGARVRGIKANDVDVPVHIDANAYDVHVTIELMLRREATVEIEYELPRRLPR
jgi:hypothetical protein